MYYCLSPLQFSSTKAIKNLHRAWVLLAVCAFALNSAPVADTAACGAALIIVDVQKDFVDPDGRLPADSAQAQNMIAAINGILENADTTALEVIYIRNAFKWWQLPGNIIRRFAGMKGAEGARPADGLVLVNDTCFTKHHFNAFTNKHLHKHLSKNGISELYICGMYADVCVLATVKGAVKHGYRVYVIRDALSTVTDVRLDASYEKLESVGATLLSIEEFTGKESEP